MSSVDQRYTYIFNEIKALIYYIEFYRSLVQHYQMPAFKIVMDLDTQSDSQNCKDLMMAYTQVRKPYVTLIMNHLKVVQDKGPRPA